MYIRVCLDVIKPGQDRPSVLDFGCGTLAVVEYIERTEHRSVLELIDYQGVDIAPEIVLAARRRYPHYAHRVRCGDILAGLPLDTFDYAIANGTFTWRESVSWQDMWQFVQDCVAELFAHTRRGLSFHVLSGHVDYETDQWFHVRFDVMADFITKLTRSFVLRNDYTPYGYTVYAYHA